MESQDKPSDNFEMHAVVQGYVQGVGFRATTRYFAMQLGLKGTVRNLPDGTVEIYAQGAKVNLERLIHLLKTEGGGRIDNVTTRYFAPRNIYDNFKIVH